MDMLYRFNLGLTNEDAAQIENNFDAHDERVDVYKKNSCVYAEFTASSEKEIDVCIEDACSLILAQYPHLTLEGAGFEE